MEDKKVALAAENEHKVQRNLWDAAAVTSEVEVKDEFKAKILVIGVGGGGSNALNNIIRSSRFDRNCAQVRTLAVNTDADALKKSQAHHRVVIGRDIGKGKGAGGQPEVGKKAAEASEAELRAIIEPADMVFITAGMGGGTGTGAAPVIARLAKSMDKLTVAMVTLPFNFEGQVRSKNGQRGLDELKENVDSYVVIENERINNLINERGGGMGLMDAFRVVDEVLCYAVVGVVNMITGTGYINVDFADVTTVMKDGGIACMSIGESSGEKALLTAAQNAIKSPLATSAPRNAKHILYYIDGNSALPMNEINEVSQLMSKIGAPDVNIIWGVGQPDEQAAQSEDARKDAKVTVTVIATGFQETPEPPVRSRITQPQASAKGAETASAEAPQPDMFDFFGSDDDFDKPAVLRRRS